jgi:uncharacterized DUF497 family protein
LIWEQRVDEKFLNKYTWHNDKNQLSIEKHGLSFQSAAVAMEHGKPILTGTIRNDGRVEHYASLNNEGVKVVSEQQGKDTRIISAHRDTRNSRDLCLEKYDALSKDKGVSRNAEHNSQYAEWRQLDKNQRDRSEPDVYKINSKHLSEQKEFSEKNGISLDEAKKSLMEQQKLEAVKDRKPRMERDSVEREELAKEQGNSFERVSQKQEENIISKQSENQNGHEKSVQPQRRKATMRDLSRQAEANLKKEGKEFKVEQLKQASQEQTQQKDKSRSR